jgi:HEPN domain-containing protein
MPERSRDWLGQAERDLQLARTARDAGHHEWSAFASHQAAEKAIEAMYQQMHAMEKAMVLDLHYIPTRHPNGFERGAPMDYYSRKDAGEAISNAEAIIEFYQNHIH